MKGIASITLTCALLIAHALSAQQQSKDSPPTQYIQTSGQVLTFANAPGSGTITLEYLFTGVSAPTITVQGCAQGGTCTTLTALSGTNPYTTATNAMVQFAGGYFSYTVTATYTGTGAITVNFVGIQAKSGSGGGGGATTFDQIGSGTNTTHGLVVGTGSVLTTADTGIINANELNGTLLSGLATGILCNTTGTGVPTANCLVPASSLPAATATTQGATKLGNPALGINHVTYQVLSDGDSYASGQGATQLGLGYTYLTIQDVPAMAPSLQKGVPGTLMPQIANVTALNWVPNLTYPSVLLTNGGNNDYNSDTCSHAATSNCITNYQESASANAMWAAIPQQQRLCASSGATAAGTWTSSVTVPFSTYNCSTITTGTALASIVSGSTLTFSVPNTNNGYVGVTQATANASTGTYTIGIGPAGSPVLQTNPCTGTTVFSGGPCGGTAMPSTPGMQRNQFFNAAWVGQAIQVVVTTTNTGSTAIMATDYAVTTWPANTGSAWVANSGAAFDITGVYSNAAAATVTQLRATGANVFLVDIRAALLALAGNGVSLTPTADCPVGSTSSGHPSNCGNQAEYRAEISAQQANNYIYSFPQLGGTTGTNQGVINGPLMVSTQFSNVAVGATSIVNHNLNVNQDGSLLLKMFDQGFVGAGLHYNGLGTTMPDGVTNQIYESLWGSDNTAGATYGCFEPAPTSTSVILNNTVWVPTACVNFISGAFTTKGSITATQVVSSLGENSVASTVTALLPTYRMNTVTLAAPYTFTLAAGNAGDETTLNFCQNATGSFTVTPPANVHGLGTVGTTPLKCNAQHFKYSTSQTAWLADAAMVMNQ